MRVQVKAGLARISQQRERREKHTRLTIWLGEERVYVLLVSEIHGPTDGCGCH